MNRPFLFSFLLLFLMVFSAAAEDFWNSDAWKTTNSGKSARFTPLDFDSKDVWYGSHFFRGAYLLCCGIKCISVVYNVSFYALRCHR